MRVWKSYKKEHTNTQNRRRGYNVTNKRSIRCYFMFVAFASVFISLYVLIKYKFCDLLCLVCFMLCCAKKMDFPIFVVVVVVVRRQIVLVFICNLVPLLHSFYIHLIIITKKRLRNAYFTGERIQTSFNFP